MRGLHLLEGNDLKKYITKFPETGNNIIAKISFQKNLVYINDHQYFQGIHESVWKVYIGGYQPAQKWLKDRKGRTLTYEDVTHYRKIIYVLEQTIEIMKQIDNHIIL